MAKPKDPPVEISDYVVRPSRAAKKRELQSWRDLVISLVELTPGRFAQLDLSDELRRALVEARKLTSANAKRRQIQFVTGLIDGEDAVKLRQGLQDLDQKR